MPLSYTFLFLTCLRHFVVEESWDSAPSWASFGFRPAVTCGYVGGFSLLYFPVLIVPTGSPCPSSVCSVCFYYLEGQEVCFVAVLYLWISMSHPILY